MINYDLNTIAIVTLDEMKLWAKNSKEHPIFIRKVADLTKKCLSSETISGLDKMNIEFAKIEVKAHDIQRTCHYDIINEIKKLILRYLAVNKEFVSLLEKTKSVGKDDLVWQLLLQHIIEEQQYTGSLFECRYYQLNNY